MTVLNRILKANQEFIKRPHAADITCRDDEENASHGCKLAVFTCMDTRLVNFLEPAMGLERGEAKVIKNAGNSVTGPFEATIRSLLISIFELGVEEIIVIGHFDCGMSHSNAEALIAKMLSRGISRDAIKMVEKDLREWIDNFHHPIDNIRHTVALIRNNPLIPADVPVHGLVVEPSTGELQLIVDGYKNCKQA